MSKGATYLVASKADDASHIAVNGHSQANGHDAEVLEAGVAAGARRPGGRKSVPSQQDWEDPQQQKSSPDSRVKRAVDRGDDDVSDISLADVKPKPVASTSNSPAVSNNNSSAAGSSSQAATSSAPASAVIVIPAKPGPQIGITSGHFSMQGIRPEMEDRATLLPHPEFNRAGNLPDNMSRSFFAVFDGHGGDVSAEYCRQHVHNNMMVSESFMSGRPAEGLRAALLKTESEFCAACRRINLLTSSGTTAITAYIENDILYVANIG